MELTETLEDVSINNEYENENDFKPYSYSKSFSQLSMLAMTPSSSLQKIKLWDSASTVGIFSTK